MKCVHEELCVTCDNFGGMVGLQNCMDILKSEPDPCTGTCQMSSDDGNLVVGIKVEEAADLQLEEDPGPTTFPLIKTEPSVGCVSVVRFIAQISRIPCPSVCFLSA